jgi:hypothetical protein
MFRVVLRWARQVDAPSHQYQIARQRSPPLRNAHPLRDHPRGRGRQGPWGRRGCSRVPPFALCCKQGDATTRHFSCFRRFPKLRVAGSNPIPRSRNPKRPRQVMPGASSSSGEGASLVSKLAKARLSASTERACACGVRPPRLVLDRGQALLLVARAALLLRRRGGHPALRGGAARVIEARAARQPRQRARGLRDWHRLFERPRTD